MVPAPLPLPTQFPCWCRAVYSWGGESKRDLGFIEGDLIECLNAGDGSWWVGRLYRDRRTVGSFPSNFVQVLSAEFRPHTRSVSPMPGSNTPSPKNTPAKSKTFRKPFEAYAKAPHYTSAKQPTVFRETPKEPPKKTEPQLRHRESSAASYIPGGRESLDRAPSPQPRREASNLSYSSRPPSRAPSPQPRRETSNLSYSSKPPSRAPSPQPRRETSNLSYSSRPPSRVPSPQPLDGYQTHDPSRAPSPAPFHHTNSFRAAPERSDSPPPPAPPPHRHATQRQRRDEEQNPYLSRHGSNASYVPYRPSRQNSTLSYDDRSEHPRRDSFEPDDHGYHDRPNGHHTPRSHSPSLGENNMTPSPLREAMDGVMEQLDELGGWGAERETRAQSPTPPVDPWSPECFDMVRQHSSRKQHRKRPMTSMGIANSDEGYETWSGESSQDSHQGVRRGHTKHDSELPQLSSYVSRMEKQFESMHRGTSGANGQGAGYDAPPPPPPKGLPFERPKSSMGQRSASQERKLRTRKSAHEISRTYTTKTNATDSSSGQSNTSYATQSTNRTLWSGASASAFSQTSAGSLARGNMRAQTALGNREPELERPETPFTGVTYHSSHASDVPANRAQPQSALNGETELGGLVSPKPVKRNIFKKIFESARTGVASNRGSIASGYTGTPNKSSPFSRSIGSNAAAMSSTPTGIGNIGSSRDVAKDMGLNNAGTDWVQVRRDVNRSNSLSKIERAERKERCQMLDHPALNPVDELYESVEGDEGADGEPVHDGVNYHAINLSQVDKNSRFVAGLTPGITAISLATTYVCRPYRSEVQRLRAIFIWVAEKITWEEDFEGEIDTTRVIESKRACAEEYAALVLEMCSAIGIHCETVRGYLKAPGEVADLNLMPRPNHWWNAVVVDNEWRIMDCCLASPSNPRRGMYSSAANNMADPWWFLARPLEVCWTHVPEHHDQQHIVPPVAHEILLNLPCTCPSFFRNGLEMVDYNTSLTRIEDLEMLHLKFNVPGDIEVVAEVESKAYASDMDGDVFESGDVVRKRALAQAEWFNGVKRYTIKALLPGDEGQGVLKVYTGKRGLMHSIKDIPHPLTLTLPVIHTGENPPYDFVTRHPTPHAQRHDIYVVQPQCQRLALNNTFVFAIRQHPSSLSSGTGSSLTPASNPGGTSPVPFHRPGSAMSMNASSANMSNPSSASGTVAGKKPAKLAIQTPGGKILRLMRKEDRKGISVGSKGISGDDDVSDGGTWETIIKCSEKGLWRGLVLADRTARWCVFAEWVCAG